jgi:hypothetical protein
MAIARQQFVPLQSKYLSHDRPSASATLPEPARVIRDRHHSLELCQVCLLQRGLITSTFPALTWRWQEGLAMKPTLVVLGAFALAGCGIAARVDARAEYQKSVADYRACLDAHPWELKACDGNRLAMEAEERAYNNLSAGPPTNVVTFPRMQRNLFPVAQALVIFPTIAAQRL